MSTMIGRTERVESAEKAKMRALEVQLLTRAMKDEAFRQELLANPREAIRQETGVEVPLSFNIEVHEVTEDTIHLVIPRVPDKFAADRMSEEDLQAFILNHAALSDGSVNTGSCCCDTYHNKSGSCSCC